MNDLLAMERYVRDHLDDRIAARAYVDLTEQVLELPHRIALRAVAAIRKQTRDAEEIEHATALLQAGSTVRDDLCEVIRSTVPYEYQREGIIIVVAGSRYPTPVFERASCYAAVPHWRWIRVGARRVLKMREALEADLLTIDHLEILFPAGSSLPPAPAGYSNS